MLVLVIATAIPCAWAGFAWMFTARASYDDEGFYLMALKTFDARQDLYARFITSYGPAYHEAAGLLFFILRLPFDLNSARLIALALWLATACLGGIVTFRLTNSLLAALAGVLLTFWIGSAFTNEPMSPAALFMPLALVMVLVLSIERWRIERRYLILGVGIAFAGLSKVNIGVLFLLAVCVAMPWHAPRYIRTRWIIAAVLFLMPILYIIALHGGRDADELGAAIGIAAWSIVMMPNIRATAHLSSKAGLMIIYGIAATTVGVTLVAAAMGDPPVTMVSTLTRVSFFFTSVAVPNMTGMGHAALGAAVVGVGCIWLGRNSWAGTVIRLVAGLVTVGPLLIYLVVFRDAIGQWPFEAPNSPSIVSGLLSLFPLFTGLIAATAIALPVGADQSLGELRGRRLLAGMAAFGVLQIFPVQGSQLWFAELPILLCGVICLSDVWALVRWPHWLVWRVPSVALIAVLAFAVPWHRGELYWAEYRAYPTLEISGARLLHDPSDTSVLEQLLKSLKAQGCTFLATFPGMLSFYPWTGLSVPPGLVLADGVMWERPEYEPGVVASLARSSGVCLIRNQVVQSDWGGNANASPSAANLVSYLDQAFHQVGNWGEYSLWIGHPSG